MAPRTETEVGSAEIYFAKKLANNDKKIRDRALKKLKIWLSSKAKCENGLEETELLKIWKGLFYCMWFSDKPLIQEELAENLSQMIHIFNPTATGVIFSKIFFVTMGREWLGIDRLRLDKFYLLVKKFIKESLFYLAKLDWNHNFVADTSQYFKDLLLSPQYPDGLKLYFAEYVLTELTSVLQETKRLPTEKVFLCLMEPYISAAAFCTSDSVLRTLRDEVLETFLSLKINKEDENGNTVTCNIPFSSLADRLCQLGAEKAVPTKNRKILFLYTDKYRKYVVDTEAKDGQISKKRKRKKKKANGKSKSTSHVSSDEVKCFQEEPTRKKKKKQNKTKSAQNTFNGDIKNVEENQSNEVKELKDNNKKLENIDINENENRIDIDQSKKSSKKRKTEPSKSIQTDIQDKNDRQVLEERSPGYHKELIQPNLSNSGDDTSKMLTDDVKLKLDFSVDSFSAVNNKNEDISINSLPAVETPKGKKKKNKSLNADDEPRPVISFIKTPPPAAFFRKAAAKTEPKKRTTKGLRKPLSTPKSEPGKKKVRIDMSKNISVADKELKLSPMPPFSPTRKPSKSAMKTKMATRKTAADFF